ncbi:MAG TPA: hypothetical protein VEA69_12565 [Tepidisphaeraceae bacterium]|nr:hypothetical protein [Tepidisphaeraceae bacterium]
MSAFPPPPPQPPYPPPSHYPPPPPYLTYYAPAAAKPWWVTLGLLGLPNRDAAWVFVWLSVALAVVCLIVGAVHHPRWLFGGLIFLAAGHYWAAIRWMDRHNAWR